MKKILYPKRAEWAEIIARPHLDVSQLTSTVRGVLDDIKSRGDEAVKEYELKFVPTSPHWQSVKQRWTRPSALLTTT